jgi:hypothetical protein
VRPLGILIIIAVALISIAAVAIVVDLNKPSREPWSILFKDKVELFVVHYEDGVEIEVTPSTPEGEKLMSACQDALDDAAGMIDGTSQAVTEIMTNMTENSRYVVAMLENGCELNIRGLIAADKLLFIPRAWREITGIGKLENARATHIFTINVAYLWMTGNPFYIPRERSYYELVDIMEQLRH